MKSKIVLSEPVDVEVSEEEDAQFQAMIEQAERDIANELRVSVRWPRAQLTVIQRAAALYGMPYQTYLKQAAFRQALSDLQAVRDITRETSPSSTRGDGPK